MLGEVFRRGGDRHPGLARDVDGAVVEPLAVHVDLDRPARGGDAREGLFPKAVVALGDAALDVDAEGEAGDLRHLDQQAGDRVAAVRREVRVGHALDRVVGPRHVVEVVALGPERELEIEAAQLRLAADELQHLEVGVALLGRQFLGADVVTVEVEQEGIGEVEVDVGDPGVVVRVIVAHPECQREPVEPVRGEHGQVVPPLLPVVVPDLVLFLAAKEPRHRADARGRLLDQRECPGEEVLGGRMRHAVGEFGQRVHDPARVMSPGEDAVALAQQRHALGDLGQALAE